MAAVKVSTYNGLRTVIKTDRHTWYADETEAAGGLDTAADPEQQLLGAVGSCMVITVQLYARRKEWPLEKVEVELDIEKLNAADYPNYQGDAQFVYEVRERVTLHGDQLTDEQRTRLMEISTKCPVRRILTSPTFFVHDAPQATR